MNFETSRSSALNKLNSFIEKDILNYNSKRNFDFGIKNRNNVSCLSPYITHRLITEYETVKKVLLKQNKNISEKDLELFHLTDSSDEVLNILNSFHNKENFSPNF